MNPDEQFAPDELTPTMRRRPPRGRVLFAPLLAAIGRLLVFVPVFASGVFAVWVSRLVEPDPFVALRNTVLATALNAGLAMLYFVRAQHVLRWVGLAQLMVTLIFAVLVALRFVTGGKINL
jgi:hypothetical protein